MGDREEGAGGNSNEVTGDERIESDGRSQHSKLKEKLREAADRIRGAVEGSKRRDQDD